MGKIVAGVVAVVLLVLGYTWLFDTDIEGGEMPDVEVQGEVEAPEVEVRGPEIERGEKTVTVPTIDIEGADDDADGAENELIEGDAKTGPISEDIEEGAEKAGDEAEELGEEVEQATENDQEPPR